MTKSYLKHNKISHPFAKYLNIIEAIARLILNGDKERILSQVSLLSKDVRNEHLMLTHNARYALTAETWNILRLMRPQKPETLSKKRFSFIYKNLQACGSPPFPEVFRFVSSTTQASAHVLLLEYFSTDYLLDFEMDVFAQLLSPLNQLEQTVIDKNGLSRLNHIAEAQLSNEEPVFTDIHNYLTDYALLKKGYILCNAHNHLAPSLEAFLALQRNGFCLGTWDNQTMKASTLIDIFNDLKDLYWAKGFTLTPRAYHKLHELEMRGFEAFLLAQENMGAIDHIYPTLFLRPKGLLPRE